MCKKITCLARGTNGVVGNSEEPDNSGGEAAGEDRYAETPSKNDESHICDGAGYGFLGVGEFDRLGGRRRDDENRQTQADGDFDVFA